MDADLIRPLRCPVCRQSLRLGDRALRCERGHHFDIARQGYVDLSGGRIAGAGDSAGMVAARAALLGAGHFDFLTNALLAAAPPEPAGLVVDVGAGTGHHLTALLDARPDRRGLAVDVSKPALRRAARAHARLVAVRADAWRGLPIADAAATMILNVFAPRHGAEFARILHPAGRLLVVTPEPEHLRELGPALRVDPQKSDRLTAALGDRLVREDDHRVTAALRLSHAHATAALEMGPSARHTDPDRLARAIANLPDPVPVTAAMRLSIWRRADSG